MTAAERSRRANDDRPGLAMLHGFALDARMWRRQVASLRSTYRILLLDLPGFGPQARALGEIAPASEMARAMDAARLDRAHLVATSYGAAVAVDYALQHPGRVASLVLAAPMLVGRRLGIESWSRCASLAKDGDVPTAAEVWLDDSLFEPLRYDEDLFEEVRHIVLDYAGGHWTGTVTSLWSEPDPLARLKALEIPTLLISGEQDIPSFMLMAEAYAKALPHARREIVQGVGHHVSLEAPDAFDALVESFLDDVGQGATPLRRS